MTLLLAGIFLSVMLIYFYVKYFAAKEIHVDEIIDNLPTKKRQLYLNHNTFITKHLWANKYLPFEDVQLIKIYSIVTLGLEHENCIEICCRNNFKIYLDYQQEKHLQVLDTLTRYLLKKSIHSFNINWAFLPFENDSKGEDMIYKKAS